MQVHNSSPVGIPVMTVHALGSERGEEMNRGTNAGEISAVDLEVTTVCTGKQIASFGGLKV